MDVNHAALAPAASPAAAPSQAKSAQEVARHDQDETEQSTARPGAADPSDFVDIRADVPGGVADEGEPSPVAESDPPAEPANDDDRSRGRRVNLSA